MILFGVDVWLSSGAHQKMNTFQFARTSVYEVVVCRLQKPRGENDAVDCLLNPGNIPAANPSLWENGDASVDGWR